MLRIAYIARSIAKIRVKGTSKIQSLKPFRTVRHGKDALAEEEGVEGFSAVSLFMVALELNVSKEEDDDAENGEIGCS
jgi:hypothetical protein